MISIFCNPSKTIQNQQFCFVSHSEKQILGSQTPSIFMCSLCTIISSNNDFNIKRDSLKWLIKQALALNLQYNPKYNPFYKKQIFQLE